MKIYKTIQVLANDNATCKIVIRFKKNDRLMVATGVKFTAKQWSPSLSQVIGQDARAKNNAIEKKWIEVLKIAKEVEILPEEEKRIILSQSLKTLRSIVPATKSPSSFNEYCRKKLNENRAIAVGTFQNHKKILAHLDEICPRCHFLDINLDLVDKISRFCLQKKYSVETTYNVHKTIRSYIAKAVLDGLFPSDPVKNPYKHFRPKKEHKTTRCFLTLGEIEALEKASLPLHLEIYRDAFVFLCYTGLRISDFQTLNHTMLNRDILIVYPQKTSGFGTVVHLPIKQLFAGKPYSIWEKYDFDFSLNKYFDLELNRNIKLIANMIGLDKKLTCHVARHSFLTNIAIKTKNLFTVMKLGGLRKTDTAMIYIHLAEMEAGDMLKDVSW